MEIMSESDSLWDFFKGKGVFISDCRCSGSTVIFSRCWWRPS